MKLLLCLMFAVSSLYSQVTINNIKGSALIINDKNEKIEAKKGDVLNQGYSISTSSNSEAEILLNDTGIVVLYENSRFTLNPPLNEEKTSFLEGLFGIKKLYADDSQSLIDYLYGKATFFIKKLSEKQYSVRTPTAVCGVRGTSFSINSDDNLSEIGLFKGSVELKNNKDNKNEVKVLKPGQTAYITSVDIKIDTRLSKIMEKEKKRAEKLEKYFEKVNLKIKERNEKLDKKLK